MGDRSPDDMYVKKGIKPPNPVLIEGGNPTKASGFKSIESSIVDALGWKK
jgi:hypothetical protein